jgi:hypothetical protein
LGVAPPQLKIFWQTQRLGMPLYPGALVDQPHHDIYEMEYLDGVFKIVEAWRKGSKDKKVHDALMYLTKEGLMNE